MKKLRPIQIAPCGFSNAVCVPHDTKTQGNMPKPNKIGQEIAQKARVLGEAFQTLTTIEVSHACREELTSR